VNDIRDGLTHPIDHNALMEDYISRHSWLDKAGLKSLVIEEYDPNGKSAKEPGSKLDAGKSPVFRGLLDYFPRACMAVANVSAIGAAKYAWKGWETVPDGVARYSDALARHLVKEGYEYLDEDTQRPHAEQVAWNAMARLELILREQEGR